MEEDKDIKKRKKNAFDVDTQLIPQASLEDEQNNAELNELGLSVFNQDAFEQGVMNQVDDALAKEEQIRLRRILVKELTTIDDDIKLVQGDLARVDAAVTRIADLDTSDRATQRQLETMRKQQSNKMKQLKTLTVRRENALKKRNQLDGEINGLQDMTEADTSGSTFDEAFQVQGKQKETAQQRMMRLGEMTPFGTLTNRKHTPKRVGTFEHEKYLAAKVAPAIKVKKDFQKYLKKKSTAVRSTEKKEDEEMEKETKDAKEGSSRQEERQQKDVVRLDEDDIVLGEDNDDIINDDDDDDFEMIDVDEDDEFVPDKDDLEDSTEDDKDLSEYSEEEAIMGMSTNRKRKRSSNKPFKRKRPRPPPVYHEEGEEVVVRTKVKRDHSIRRERDDADPEDYSKRLRRLQKEEAKQSKQEIADQNDDDDIDNEFEGGLQVPPSLWKKLFRYQKTGVRWLWELHQQEAGGIVGDEMGLGKTIQTIAFLSALRYSKVRNINFPYRGLGPSIIVCPTTIMHQWVKECHKWWPEFRVAILHSSGTFTGSDSDLVRSVAKSHGILVTSYTTLVLHQELVLRYNWHYVILDEGHKIRNPDAKVTLCCKQFRTPHRIILSGSPIQNNLKELWSLFDFVFPGKLGTLPDFMQHFSVPIVQGGYANATQMQVETAYKCACVLRDTIHPYLIRRMKADVKSNINLPAKNEQVLFCRITDEQRDVYMEYLASRECNAILQGRFKVFAGLITLRKICNHPDLSTGGPHIFKGETTNDDPSLEYGFWRRSGKMIVVEALLRLWKKQNRRVLLFTQSKSMLNILEKFVQEKEYTYLSMDGSTSIPSRQPMVTQYNSDPSIFLFLMTTRVGGLGINLTGADRVIIFDPDWNPSTDMQARERAWRIGQRKQVTIYRLLTSGTIEEKIYHRQIFKQFLTNRILKDPKQRRLFQSQQLYELFTLGSKENGEGTETSALFAGTGCNVKVPPKIQHRNRFDEIQRRKDEEAEVLEQEEEKKKEEEEEQGKGRKKRRERAESEEEEGGLDMEELNRMKELARKLSRKMEEEKGKKERKKSGEEENADSKFMGDSDVVIKQEVVDPSEFEVNSGDNLYKNSICNKEQTFSNEMDVNVIVKQEKDKMKKWKIPLSRHSNGTAETSGGDSQVNERNWRQSGSWDDDLGAYSGSNKHTYRTKQTGSKKQSTSDKDRPSQSDRLKKKRRKHRDARFEGEKIPHLVKCQEKKKPLDGEKEEMEEKDGKKAEQSKQEDDYVLRELFKKTGIDGAMKHDKIVDSSRPDYAIVEAEAARVAKEAAMALKRSRQQCASALDGLPNWTGANGGRLGKPRFGQKKNALLVNGSDKRQEISPSTSASPSEQQTSEKTNKDMMFDGSMSGNTSLISKDNSLTSNDLLTKIRSRKQISANVMDQEDDFLRPDVHKTLDPKDEELLKDIREFIAVMSNVNGEASSQEIVLNFGQRLPKSDAPKFKAMLKQICDLDHGVWRLKSDFR